MTSTRTSVILIAQHTVDKSVGFSTLHAPTRYSNEKSALLQGRFSFFVYSPTRSFQALYAFSLVVTKAVLTLHLWHLTKYSIVPGTSSNSSSMTSKLPQKGQNFKPFSFIPNLLIFLSPILSKFISKAIQKRCAGVFFIPFPRFVMQVLIFSVPLLPVPA